MQGFVLVCMGQYMLVLDHELIVNIPIWCHTALQSTFNATFTVDMPVMSLCLDFHSAGWSEGNTMAQVLM